MNWSDERYVRVYTRDTTEWIVLGWEGQCLFLLLLRKADRAGLVSMGKHGPRGLAALLHMPIEIVTKGLESLLEDGCIEQHGDTLMIKNFIEAQEAQASPKQRQREYREREREALRAGLPAASQKGCVIYFVQSENGGHIKIGRADDLATRLAGLQTGRPDKLVVLASAPGTRDDERRVHDRLAADRERGEWFRPEADVLRVIALVNQLGQASWRHLEGVLSDAASPETSPVTSPVTPNRTVPNCADPPKSPTGDLPGLKIEKPLPPGFWQRFVARAGKEWGLPERFAKSCEAIGAIVPGREQAQLLAGALEAQQAGYSEQDFMKLADFIAAGGVGWRGAAWQHVSKNFVAELSKALAWDGVSDPRQRTPTAKAPPQLPQSPQPPRAYAETTAKRQADAIERGDLPEVDPTVVAAELRRMREATT